MLVGDVSGQTLTSMVNAHRIPSPTSTMKFFARCPKSPGNYVDFLDLELCVVDFWVCFSWVALSL